MEKNRIHILMIGDVVGEPGIAALEKKLPALIAKYSADFTVVNGENAAAGFGLTEACLDRILAAGACVVTGGNHIWEKREFWPVLDGEKPVLRPANYPAIGPAEFAVTASYVPALAEASPAGAAGEEAAVADKLRVPGKSWLRLKKNGFSAAVVNLQGRELMTPIDCPFRRFDALFEEIQASGSAECPAASIPIIVDFHAEAAEEKESLGYYLDGRAAIVAGTHTHVQTADERILPGGTAYISDLGMTGAGNGIIGMDRDICLRRARTQAPLHLECARPACEDDYLVQGIAVELDAASGKALAIERIYAGEKNIGLR